MEIFAEKNTKKLVVGLLDTGIKLTTNSYSPVERLYYPWKKFLAEIEKYTYDYKNYNYYKNYKNEILNSIQPNTER